MPKKQYFEKGGKPDSPSLPQQIFLDQLTIVAEFADLHIAVHDMIWFEVMLMVGDAARI
jgi:hypothetical protein